MISLLLLLLLLMQYLLVFADIAFEETSRSKLKKDIIPFYGLYVKILRKWYKLPK